MHLDGKTEITSHHTHSWFSHGKGRSFTCQACGTPLTVQHIITGYLQYEQVRSNLHVTEKTLTTLGPNPDQNKEIIKSSMYLYVLSPFFTGRLKIFDGQPHGKLFLVTVLTIFSKIYMYVLAPFFTKIFKIYDRLTHGKIFLVTV
jgi:hypothetical protein